MQHVAKTLLGVEQDGSTIERAAIPWRLRKCPLAELPASPAPFELRPAPLPFSEPKPKQGAVFVKECIVRLEPDRSLVLFEGEREVSLIREGQCQVVMRSRIVLCQAKCPTQTAGG